MAREKRKQPASVLGGPKERHKRALRSQYDPTAPVPPGLIAKPAIPKSKHHSYFEFVKNKEKKKKLEFQITSAKTPPPGFEFIPIGNPELTTACKEISREKDAMIFIVSNSTEAPANQLAHHVHRVGHHIRGMIADEARARLGQNPRARSRASGGSPEPIPRSQAEYNAQVDAAIRDLFPRIPNTDRQMIIEHAFRRGATFKGEKPVGLSEDITLARRVQLATLAHIRHTHTRYDTLLRETSWQNARRVVETLCLDTLVKWRGDEETGRDQLDEILREVVVISDSEDDDDDGDSGEESDLSSIVEVISPIQTTVAPDTVTSNTQELIESAKPSLPKSTPRQTAPLAPSRAKGKARKTNKKKAPGKKKKRGFKRYSAWQEAIRRYRKEQAPERQQTPMDCRPDHDPGSYHQLATRTAASYAPKGAQDAFPRIASEGAGPAPNENGYVGRPPLNPAPHSYSVPARHSMYEKVNSPGHAPSPNVQSPARPVAVATNHLQDMLVRSIEPVSPETMPPSFVRSVPPRSQGYNDSSPGRPGMQYSPRVLTPLGESVTRNEPSFANPRVVSDQVPTGIRHSGNYHGDNGSQITRIPPGREYISSHDGLPPLASSYHPDARLQEPLRSGFSSPSQNIPRQGPRPGERLNPIIMEDRGGFFERVRSLPEGSRPLPRNFDHTVNYQSTREARRATEPHRVVDWEEGSRILRESQGAGVEIIPINRGHPLPHQPRIRSLLADAPLTHHRTPDNMMRQQGAEEAPGLYHRSGSETRPIFVRRSSPHYQSAEETRRFDGPPPPPRYNEPLMRHYEINSSTMDARANVQREYPLRPPLPENVIVLE